MRACRMIVPMSILFCCICCKAFISLCWCSGTVIPIWNIFTPRKDQTKGNGTSKCFISAISCIFSSFSGSLQRSPRCYHHHPLPSPGLPSPWSTGRPRWCHFPVHGRNVTQQHVLNPNTWNRCTCCGLCLTTTNCSAISDGHKNLDFS